MASRISREKQTINAMLSIFCNAHHKSQRIKGERLCGNCSQLEDYAIKKLDICKFGEEKPACVDCPVHCYKPEMREEIRKVMRYSGPRMLLRHPILAIQHMFDGKKKHARQP